MAKRIGIFVIAYNAENKLAGVLGRIPPQIVEKVEEIFVIDDCSTDRTYDVGRSYDGPAAAKLTVHRNPVNLMYGGNQKRGYQYAIERGLDMVVLLHGDGQYAPEVMDRLLDPLERGRAEMVMGSRMLEQGAALRGRMPLYKYVGNKILTTTQNWLLGTRFSEFHSGYRAYACHALKTLDFDAMTDSWHFDTQIIMEFLRRGYQITEVPIPTYYGDEICHVNGIPYAYQCVRATAQYAWRNRLKPRAALRASQRSSK
jgi:glycosyltransferase involved in cell wall biosynthesis